MTRTSFPGRTPDPGHSPEDEGGRGAGALLGALDPGREDAAYWVRFHRDTVAGAAFELARRRREAERTVVDVVSSWSRTLLPLALAAAAAAGIFLARAEAPLGDGHLLVEDVLGMGMTEPLPFAVDDDDDFVGGLLLASEVY
ncbi:MAG: hypothetical protein RQ751_05195 [Longimicrobiales bacterium]|nr:hypothetical protein [Longimicrobiales bacterium]